MPFEPPILTKINRSPEGGGLGLPNFPASYIWPGALAVAASRAIASSLEQFARYASGGASDLVETGQWLWTTQHQVRLELGTMELRNFAANPRAGVPALICAPFALHYATIADFAPGRSIVEALRNHGIGGVYLTDWRSAGPEMRFLSIDSYLADLNVAVDELRPPVDLIGLCQGGWLALIYAARFPHKVRRLVLAGAPVDLAAERSKLSGLAASIPLAAFEQFVNLEGGRVCGHHVRHMWGPVLGADDERRILQVSQDDYSTTVDALLARFRHWNERTVDLPGTYYLQVVSWLYKENRLADGRFMALGQRVDLASLFHPIFLLGAREDELVAPDQLFAAANRIGTPRQHIKMATEPCGHLSLFLGAETIKRSWTRIADWLSEDL